MDVIVFSKDRACQLDLCLKALWQNLDVGTVRVVYKASNAEFDAGYDALMAHHQRVQWHRQYDLRELLIGLLEHSNAYSILVLCDDFVMTRVLCVSAIESMLMNTDINAVHLFMGLNVERCYAKPGPEQCVGRGDVGDFITWPWGINQLDWGYPNHISASVYRSEWLLRAVRMLQFATPNQLEGRMNYTRAARRITPWLCAAPRIAAAVGLPANVVQSDAPDNPHGSAPDQTPEVLNARFLDGWRIEYAPFRGLLADAACIEPVFKFYRPQGRKARHET